MSNVRPLADSDDDSRLALSRARAATMAQRVRTRDAQLRSAFVESRDPSRQPPLAQVLRGGRGGEVRLKLYLSLLWLAVQPPHDTSLPSRVWAELLALDDPGDRGARRVAAALRWLAGHDLIAIESRPGASYRVTLLEESGTGRPYSVPGAEIRRLMARDDDWTPHRYAKVPSILWTNGWIAALSASGLAMLLVLLVRESDATDGEVWFSPALAERRFRLSPDTRTRGMADLREFGLVSVKRRPISRSALEVVRLRNVYALRREALEQSAPRLLGPRSRRTSSDDA